MGEGRGGGWGGRGWGWVGGGGGVRMLLVVSDSVSILLNCRQKTVYCRTVAYAWHGSALHLTLGISKQTLYWRMVGQILYW